MSSYLSETESAIYALHQKGLSTKAIVKQLDKTNVVVAPSAVTQIIKKIEKDKAKCLKQAAARRYKRLAKLNSSDCMPAVSVPVTTNRVSDDYHICHPIQEPVKPIVSNASLKSFLQWRNQRGQKEQPTSSGEHNQGLFRYEFAEITLQLWRTTGGGQFGNWVPPETPRGTDLDRELLSFGRYSKSYGTSRISSLISIFRH